MPNITLDQCKRCVGPGWAGLIDEIYAALPVDAHISDVKEKYGSLRFYVDGVSEEVYDIIDKCELRSYIICEVCGKPGRVRKGGWIKTLCDGCDGEDK